LASSACLHCTSCAIAARYIYHPALLAQLARRRALAGATDFLSASPATSALFCLIRIAERRRDPGADCANRLAGQLSNLPAAGSAESMPSKACPRTPGRQEAGATMMSDRRSQVLIPAARRLLATNLSRHEIRAGPDLCGAPTAPARTRLVTRVCALLWGAFVPCFANAPDGAFCALLPRKGEEMI